MRQKANMKITVNTPDEFLKNVEQDKASIAEVWIRVDEYHASDKNDIDFNVWVWLTCVVDRERCPYILEYGKCVGMNIEQGDDQTDIGTVKAAAVVEAVEKRCGELDIKCRQGKVEF